MSMWIRRMHKRGFTLVELLVVIAIIGILVALLLPKISEALFKAKLVQVANNGRQIHQSIVSAEADNIYGVGSSVWPTGSVTSTRYFHYLITNRFMTVNYSFFAAPGVPAAQSDLDFLGSGQEGQRNAWCVVSESEYLNEVAPFLFTRNLYIQTLKDNLTMEQNGLPKELADASRPQVQQPFGKKGFVFVNRGGATFTLVKNDLMFNSFTTIFTRVQNVGTKTELITNFVMRPGSQF